MRLLIFDMDGVLVDPTGSYRQALISTVYQLSGLEITHEEIAAIKNRGGFNDNTLVVEAYLAEMESPASRNDIRRIFRQEFWGDTDNGHILGEKWLPKAGVMERLAQISRLAIYTGRNMRSARFSLKRFAPGIPFEPIMTSEQVDNLKPAPDGLLKILEALPGVDPVYVGDNIDDARCARSAGVPFIGVAAATTARREELAQLFLKEKAISVIESVNDLESELPTAFSNP